MPPHHEHIQLMAFSYNSIITYSSNFCSYVSSVLFIIFPRLMICDVMHFKYFNAEMVSSYIFTDYCLKFSFILHNKVTFFLLKIWKVILPMFVYVSINQAFHYLLFSQSLFTHFNRQNAVQIVRSKEEK